MTFVSKLAQNEQDSNVVALWEFYLLHRHVDGPRNYPLDIKLSNYVNRCKLAKQNASEILRMAGFYLQESVIFHIWNKKRSQTYKDPPMEVIPLLSKDANQLNTYHPH